jgi:hypothetical protein
VSVDKSGLGNNTVVFETLEGNKLETIEDYVVTIGEEYIRPELEFREMGLKKGGEDVKNMEGNNPSRDNDPRELINRIKSKASENPVKDYQKAMEYYQADALAPEEVVDLYELRSAVKSLDIDASLIDRTLDNYFSDIPNTEARADQLRFGVPEEISFEQIRERLSMIKQMAKSSDRIPMRSIEHEQKKYLFGVDQVLDDN